MKNCEDFIKYRYMIIYMIFKLAKIGLTTTILSISIAYGQAENGIEVSGEPNYYLIMLLVLLGLLLSVNATRVLTRKKIMRKKIKKQ